jgi:DNA-binding MarR family transcriptional regulator
MPRASRAEAADRIHSASIHLLRRVRHVDEEAMGISPARASALSVLVYGGPRTMTELADAERVKVPTMSRLVAAMEEEGLVRREPHATDARSVRIHPTARARRVLKRGRERRLDLLAHLLRDANAREVAVVREAAEIVERALRSG